MRQVTTNLTASQPGMVIDVSDYQSRRLPSKKWRERIKQAWEVDPLDCPRGGSEMKLIALIDDNEVIEKILRHLARSYRTTSSNLSWRIVSGLTKPSQDNGRALP